MERLLGSQATFSRHSRTLQQTRDHSPRGAPYEEFAESAGPRTPSALAPALRKSSKLHAQNMAKLPLGSPEYGHEPSRSLPARRAERAALRVVPVGPNSYRGAGVVERNRKRAERRTVQRATRKQKAAEAVAAATRANL